MPILKKINQLLNARDKRTLLLLVVFSICVSAVETAGVSVVMPFIAVATDFSSIHNNPYYQKAYSFLGLANDVEFILVFGAALLGFYLFRAVLNLAYFHLLARFSQGRYYNIATRLFDKYLQLHYVDFAGRNSGLLTKTIVTEAGFLVHIISSLLLMVSEVFVMLFLYAMMLWTHWKVTLLFTVVMLLKIGFLGKVLTKKIKATGKARAAAQDKLFTMLNSTFGNFKFIKLQPSQGGIGREFAHASQSYAQANIANVTYSHFPRLFLELGGFGLIVLMVMYSTWRQQGDITDVVPLMSLFVLALYRLLPSVNRIMGGYNSILYHYKAVDIIAEDLAGGSESLGSEPLPFARDIAVRGLCFAYPGQKQILHGIDLTIAKGQKIGFKGESGAGKTTLVDMLMGLYVPTQGTIAIDGQVLDTSNLRAWRAKIGYIPQQVYLFDGSVADNVVFGKAYDEQRLVAALKQANIYDFLASNQGLQTPVGEGGIQLSGGQKQRIAIARALYGDPEVLVLDEATSALDNDTEAKIMDEIYKASENRTLIVIAHRLSTITRCEKIYTLVDGRLETL